MDSLDDLAGLDLTFHLAEENPFIPRKIPTMENPCRELSKALEAYFNNIKKICHIQRDIESLTESKTISRKWVESVQEFYPAMLSETGVFSGIGFYTDNPSRVGFKDTLDWLHDQVAMEAIISQSAVRDILEMLNCIKNSNAVEGYYHLYESVTKSLSDFMRYYGDMMVSCYGETRSHWPVGNTTIDIFRAALYDLFQDSVYSRIHTVDRFIVDSIYEMQSALTTLITSPGFKRLLELVPVKDIERISLCTFFAIYNSNHLYPFLIEDKEIITKGLGALTKLESLLQNNLSGTEIQARQLIDYNMEANTEIYRIMAGYDLLLDLRTLTYIMEQLVPVFRHVLKQAAGD